MVCRICNLSGHNARTCPKKEEGQNPMTIPHGTNSRSYHSAPITKDMQDLLTKKINSAISHQTKIKESEQKLKKNVLQLPPVDGKNIAQLTPKPPKPSSATQVTPIPKATSASTIPVIKSNITIKVNSRKTESEVNFCKGCHSHNDDHNGNCKLRRCTNCKQPYHNIKTCPELDGQRKQNVQRKLQGPLWVTEDYLKRFSRGPPEKDGQGHIYMYTLSSPDSSLLKNMYKIGESGQLPEKRVHDQELHNKESYTIVESMKTPFRKWTEGLIHIQLNQFHSPRAQGDGRTEWFKGDPTMFLNTIKNIIKEVRFSSFSLDPQLT